jgi:hypothetical protein
MTTLSLILEEISELITTPSLRWLIYAISIVFLILNYSQHIIRYSSITSWFKMPIKWRIYIIGILEIFGSLITFMALWLTIPFMSQNLLPQYWYLTIFIILFAIYTQITIDSPIVTDDGSLNPPPAILLPKKYRVLISFMVLICDIIIFLQIFIHMGIVDYSKNTILHRFFLERFGSADGGNLFGWILAWVAIFYIYNDIHILTEQMNFTACQYKLPPSWNF